MNTHNRTTNEKEKGSSKGTSKHCLLFGIGVIVMLGVYGFLQEKIMTKPYEAQHFAGSVFLVLCNRLFAVVAAVIWSFFNADSMSCTAPYWKYFAVSLTNVAATTCQYQALHWVSFPVLMLGKSFKMLPVMFWNRFLSDKRYEKKDYMAAGVVSLGVCTFMTTGNISSPLNNDSTVYGVLLLGAFCAFDSFTSSFQEKLFRDHQTSTSNQMLYINLGSCLLAFSVALASGELSESIAFGFAHPSFTVDVSLLSAAAVGAQFFIFTDIKEFGALCLAATMNVRQVCSILVSYAYYGHPITLAQVIGLCCVFFTLFWKAGNALSTGKLIGTSKSKSEQTKLLPGEGKV